MAFERALDLDPLNVQAIIAMAILDMNSGEPARIKHGIKSFSRAYQLEPENPMVLNHLANHFFFKDVSCFTYYLHLALGRLSMKKVRNCQRSIFSTFCGQN